MTRPTTRLLALLLTGLFLVQGIGVFPSLQGAVEGSVTVNGAVAAAPGEAGDLNRDVRTAVETPGQPDAGETPPECADGELPCSPQDGPPPCTVVAACSAPAFLPVDPGFAPDALPNDRGLIHRTLREPGNVFLERHTPPPRA